MNTRRLYRSRTDRAIAGIAGGMADYLELDPTVVRILWILAAIFTGGLVLLLYLILAFVIPLNPYGGGYPAGSGGTYPTGGFPAGAAYAAGTGTAGAGATTGSTAWAPDWNAGWEAQRAARVERKGRAGLIIGTMLIVIGVIALADNVLPGWIDGRVTGPAVILGLGAAILVASIVRREERPSVAAAAPAPAAAPAAAAGPAAPVAEPAPSAFDAAPFSTATTGSVEMPAPEPPAAPAAYDADETTSFRAGTETDRQ